MNYTFAFKMFKLSKYEFKLSKYETKLSKYKAIMNDDIGKFG